MLNQLEPAGASGHGFVAGAAGPVLLLLVLAALFAVPAVREFIAGYFGSARSYFVPDTDSTATASSAASGDSGTEASGSASGRASDRDDYTHLFDLDVLTVGDACDVDAPPTA